MTNLSISEFARLGGKARAKKLSKKRLSEIGKMGGRPRKIDSTTKSASGT